MASAAAVMDMERACDDDDEPAVDRCDGCGGVLQEEPPCRDGDGDGDGDGEPLVIYDCFHFLHAACARGRDACPRCGTPRWVHDDDDDDDEDQPKQIEAAAAAASPPDNDLDENSALASDGMGNDDGDTGEPTRASGCDGESPAAMSVPGRNNKASHLDCCACCSRRVSERLEEKTAALIATTSVLALELERAQSRLCNLEKMYHELEDEFIRLRNHKRAREIDDSEEQEGERHQRRRQNMKLQGSSV